MKDRIAFSLLVCAASLSFAPPACAQDLGPHVRKIKEGIYVYAAKAQDSNCGIILTRDGVLMIDSGHTPADSRAVMEIVRKLSPQPVRFLIDTEPHDDHTSGHFVFSPPAVIIAAAGASESMRKGNYAERAQKLMAEDPAMRESHK